MVLFINVVEGSEPLPSAITPPSEEADGHANGGAAAAAENAIRRLSMNALGGGGAGGPKTRGGGGVAAVSHLSNGGSYSLGLVPGVAGGVDQPQQGDRAMFRQVRPGSPSRMHTSQPSYSLPVAAVFQNLASPSSSAPGVVGAGGSSPLSPSRLSAPLTPSRASKARDISEVEQMLAPLMKQVQAAAQARGNCMVVSHGTPNTHPEDHYEVLVENFLKALSPTAERALQIVADEIAKQKQMQRLLMSSEEGNDRANGGGAGGDGDGGEAADHNNSHLELSPALTNRSTKELSLDLRKALRFASTRRDVSPSMTSRFAIYSSKHNSIINPPIHDRALTARGLEVRPPTQGGPSSARRPSNSRHNIATPDAAIPSSLNTSMNRSRGASFMGGGAPAVPDSPSKQKRAMLRRKSSMRLLEQLNTDEADPVVPLRRNGWGPEGSFLEFNGENSYLSLPAIPKLEELIKSCTVDFWFQTDCKSSDGRKTLMCVGEGTRTDVGMLFHIGLNWYSDYEEGIRVYVRDGSNRVIEVIIPFPSSVITNGDDMHHFQLDIQNLEDGKLVTYIDGQAVERVRFLQTERPNTFTNWMSPMFVGGSLDDHGAPHQSLRGTICEIRLRDHVGVPIVRWPLNGLPNPSGTLVEAIGTISPDHQETIQNVTEIDKVPSEVCPKFDGQSTVLNLGPLGPFGDFLNHWGMEFTFRTTQSKKCMSLMGFTDSQHKMAEAGLILNAEPCMGKDRYRYVEHNITFYTVDSNGHCASVLIRGSERNNVVDGKWHTISFKVTDSETGRFEAQIDGLKRECICVTKEAPKAYTALRDWVCIGGHNVRSWKVKNLFEGNIKEASIMVRGERFTHLTFQEGPGSSVTQDMSGRHNNGLWQDATTRESIRHKMDWVHCNDPADGDDGGEMSHEAAHLAATAGSGGGQVTLQRHNEVSFAVVQFGCAVANGRMEEEIFDALHDTIIDIETSYEHAKGCDPGGFGSWITLPKSAFATVESVPAMRDIVTKTLSNLSADLPIAHTLVVCKIGDAVLSVLNLVGPNGTGSMSYDTTLQKWIPHVVATGDISNKRSIALSSISLGASKVLLEVSALPNVVVRLGAVNQPRRSITAPQLHQALVSEGLKWKLGLVLHSLLLNTEYSSALHFVVTAPHHCNHNEVMSVVSYQDALMESARDRCAIFIQRNWRGKLGRMRVSRIIEENHARRLKVEDVISQRKSNPIILPKKSLRAIVISIHAFQNPNFPPPRDASAVEEVSRGLSEQGYIVDRVRNPTRNQLSKVLSSIDVDSSSFVYIHGYGGLMETRYPLPFGLFNQHLAIEEESARYGILAALALEFRVLYCQHLRERKRVEDEVAAKKSKKKKKGAATPRFVSAKASTSAKQQAALLAQQQQQQATEFYNNKQDLEREEEETRHESIVVAEENVRALLIGELVQLSRKCAEFYKKQGKPAYYVVPSDCRAMEPLAADLVPVDAVMGKALLHPTAPMGFQGIVAIDLQPIKGVCATVGKGAAFLASSTGHHFTFDYLPGQVNALSWVLRKALMGHCPQMPLKNKNLFLIGAVEPAVGDDTSRDWYSFASYVIRKMKADTQVPQDRAARLDEMVKREVPYTADLVPIRTAPLDATHRSNKKKDEEMRRETAFAHITVDSSRASADPTHEARALFKLLNIVEVNQDNEVTLVLTDGNRGIDNVDLHLLQREILVSLQPGTDIALRVTPRGIALTILSHAGDKPKLAQSLLTVMNRGSNWNVPLRPFGVVSDTRIARIECHYTAKVSGTARKVHKQRKDLLKCPFAGTVAETGGGVGFSPRYSGFPSGSAVVKLLSFNE